MPTDARLAAGRRGGRHGSPRPGSQLVRSWLLIFIGLSVWALVSPPWSDVDSNSHVAEAYASAHGRLLYSGPATPADQLGTSTSIDIPASMVASYQAARCYLRKSTVNASCGIEPTTDYRPTPMASAAGRYNPVYYFVVGLPSLVLRPDLALYAMRLVSAAIVSLFLAWAVAAAWRTLRPGVSLAGLALTVPPQLAYLGGGVNPNTLEICAMIAAGGCGLAALTPGLAATDQAQLLRRSLLAMSAAVITRSISPVWVAALLLILMVVGGRALLRAAMRPPNRRWVLFGIAATVFGVAWTMLSGVVGFGAPWFHFGLFDRIGFAADRQWKLMSQQVGVLGWLEQQLPNWLLLSYLVAALIVVVLALVFTSAARRIVLLLVIAASFAVPVLLEAAQWNTNGPVWQGRYSLPLVVQVLLVGGFFLATSRRLGLLAERWVALLLTVSVVTYLICQVAGFALWTYRNVIGTGHPFALSGPWSPPISGLMLTVIWTAVVGIACGTTIRALWELGGRQLGGLPRPAHRFSDARADRRQTVGRGPVNDAPDREKRMSVCSEPNADADGSADIGE